MSTAAARNVRAVRAGGATASIAVRSAGLPGVNPRASRTSPVGLALVAIASVAVLLQLRSLASTESEDVGQSTYAEAQALATGLLRSGRQAAGFTAPGVLTGDAAIGHDIGDGHGHRLTAGGGLTQADVDKAVRDALAAQESTLLRKLQEAGAVAKAGDGDHAHGGACPDYAGAIRRKLGPGFFRLILVVFGTRPEAIKLAPLVTELTSAAGAAGADAGGGRVAVVTVATGQHEDMLRDALASFTLPSPDIALDLMSHGQTLGALGGRLLTSLSCVLDGLHRADGLAVGAVVVQGDTITASQASSAAFFLGLPVAHVEAGLRTFVGDDPFPEEVARTTITAQAALHLAPTRYAGDVLVASGVCPEAVVVTGNTGIDALVGILRAGPSRDAQAALEKLQLATPDGPALAAAITGEGDGGAGAPSGSGPVTVVVTMHRRENIGARMAGMLAAVKALAQAHGGDGGLRLLLPVHPNPAVKAAVEATLKGVPGVVLLPPLPYDSFVWVLAASHGVLTDSGGLQEEAVSLGRHVFVMRHTSERPEALRTGLGRLIGTDSDAIVQALTEWLAALRTAGAGGWPAHLRPRAGARQTFGDGSASKRISAALIPWARARTGEGATASANCRARNIIASSGAGAIGSGAPGSRAVSDHSLHSFASHAGLGVSESHHGGTLLTGHERYGRTAECAAQPESPRPPKLPYREAMALPSFYSHGEHRDSDAYGVTAIVSVWKRPNVLPRMLDALLAQGHPLKEVWVTTFASEHDDEFRRIVDEYQAKDPAGRKGRVKFIAGDPQFKYFGRFALALMAKTPHVFLLDDDSIPGAKVTQNALHLMYARSGSYYGLIGMKGHDAHVEDASHVMPDYFSAFVARPDKVVQVDLCGGFWLARTEWLRAMFAETPLTWESGEDFHVTAMLRKHEALPTFLLPSDLGDASTWGHSEDFIDISAAGDSTSDFMHKYRSNIAFGLMHAGYEPVWASDVYGEKHERASVAMVVRSASDAAALAPLYEALSSSPLGAYVRVHIVLAADPRSGKDGALDDASHGVASGGEGDSVGWDRGAKARLLRDHFGIEWNPPSRTVGVWDLNLARVPALKDVPDLPPPRALEGMRLSRAPVHIATRAATTMAGVLATLRPALVVTLHDERSPVTAGLALAAATAHVPLLGLALPDMASCGAEGAVTQGARDDTHVNSSPAPLRVRAAHAAVPWVSTKHTCEPHHAWSVARGAFNTVANSASAALAQVVDTLCACEAPDSGPGRAYARCPADVEVVPAAALGFGLQ